MAARHCYYSVCSIKVETGKDEQTYPGLLDAGASGTGATTLPEWSGIIPMQQEEERVSTVTKYHWISKYQWMSFFDWTNQITHFMGLIKTSLYSLTNQKTQILSCHSPADGNAGWEWIPIWKISLSLVGAHCYRRLWLSPSSAFTALCTTTILNEVTIGLSPGSLLTPPNSSLLWLLTPLHFCQGDLSRRKSDCASCQLQTLSQLSTSSRTKSRWLTATPRASALLTLSPPSQALLFTLCFIHCESLVCLQIHSNFLNLQTFVWHPHLLRQVKQWGWEEMCSKQTHAHPSVLTKMPHVGISQFIYLNNKLWKQLLYLISTPAWQFHGIRWWPEFQPQVTIEQATYGTN